MVSASASGPQDAYGQPRPARDEPCAEPKATDSRDLLESVLRQTLEDTEAGTPLDSADQRALSAVAARHRGETELDEPVVVELVEAVVRGHFQHLSDSAEFWQATCTQIARSLLDDPVAHGRLTSLWRRLGEVGP